jgi:glycosyltransferase involved in cell wall biosynthesis
MVKVDVVIPCYNYAQFLEACARSVLDQSIKDIRVLIIDDASRDDSPLVASKLAREDPRVAVVRHAENKGHIATYNEGIAWASAEYFLLLSADDLLVPGALERAIAVMDENPDIVLTYGRVIEWHDDRRFPNIEPLHSYTWERHDLLMQLCATTVNISTCTAIARTRTQKAIGGYRASLPHSGDLEMWLRFAANGAVARINVVQGIYRKHSAAMSNAYYVDRMRDFSQALLAFDYFFGEYEPRLVKCHGLRIAARRALSRRMFACGIGFLARTHFKEGLRLLRASVDMDPQLRYRPPIFWLFLKVARKVKTRVFRTTF